MPENPCDVLGCVYRGNSGSFGAGKCGRNTERFHYCPCQCHWDGIDPGAEGESYLAGDWPETGVGRPQEDGSTYQTHRSGRYQIIVYCDGKALIRKYIGDHTPKWEEVSMAASVEDARLEVALRLKEGR